MSAPMKPAPAFSLVCLVLVTAGGARAAAPDAGARSVAEAQQALAAARAELASAVQRIQAEPPSTPDLDAAHAAVGALKDAIDTGADREQEDLDYARAALAARKELRTQREYVDQRRAKVHIFTHRREIDAAVAKLAELARKVADKEPSPQDFEDARAQVKELKAAVDASRPFAPQDAAFATYLAQTDATLARQRNAIDERWVFLSADKHRALVEESRQAFVAAMAALGKGATDAQFEAADAAVTALEKKLDEGKVIEAGEKTYRAYAERARAEVADAKKKKDTLWTETGLARLKAEIEPTYKDLKVAARSVRARKPTEEQLAEARTVSIVVRKLVEKFQPEAARSEAFGQYVVEVKNTLVEVEVQLQLRGLDAAKADVTRALRNLEKRAPTQDHFAEVNSALLVLEKTLEPVHAKDPDMAAPAADARQLLHDGRLTMNKRRIEVDVELQRARVEEARAATTNPMNQISQPTFSKEQLQAAEASAEELVKALEAGAALTAKDREYASYDHEVKKRINELKSLVARRRIVLAATDARATLAESLIQAKAAIDAAKLPAATDADVEAASKRLDSTGQWVEGQVALEAQDRGYAAYAERVRIELMRQLELLELARQARDFRKRTGEALAAGEVAFNAAAASKELRAQKAQYEKALAQFKGCAAEGTTQVEANPVLAKVVILVEGSPSTPKAVTALCTARAEATAPLIKPLGALIAFDEGPRRSFEKATALLAKNLKTEALAEFDECTATGMTLQYRNPELKERSFEVAGGSMTLNEVTRQCSAQGKALRGK